ncbi:MAG: ABC transporter substrate-binding protein [Nitrospinota bacterium]|nr:MAG: ABC transporter substrate-binding protein [Nitrospinota bacterium]
MFPYLTKRRCAMRRRMMTWGGLGLGILVLLFFTGKALPAQEAPIPVGILEPFTGPAGWVGPNIMEGAKVALEEINQAGGPLGRPIRLISADTEGRTDAALAALSKLADVDQVVAILGPTSLTAVPVTRKVEEEVHVPIVDPTGGTSEIDNIGGVLAITGPIRVSESWT